jgi:acetate kinase
LLSGPNLELLDFNRSRIAMSDAILTLNAGSSSIKFALFTLDDVPRRRVSGSIQRIGEAPEFSARDAGGEVLAGPELGGQELSGQDYDSLLKSLIGWAEDHLGADDLVMAGHRIVHGGDAFIRPARLDDAALEALEALTPLAPLHQPHNLAPVRIIARHRPALPQIGCFDTGFHHTMDETARRLPIPPRFGLKRYGFHGISYEYIARRLRERVPEAERVVVAHLGNGASLCAMRDGQSIDTTMGATALDGLMMGTRSGAIDPGALLYLMSEHGMEAKALTHLLYTESGLLGVSGISGDMRELAGSEQPAAKRAIDLFVHRALRELGGMIASLGGIDALVFTGGIGEHDATIRAAICGRLGWLGAELDQRENLNHAPVISAAGSAVALRVIPTDEEAMIARHCQEMSL